MEESIARWIEMGQWLWSSNGCSHVCCGWAVPSRATDIDKAEEGEGGWRGTTVGAVRGERGARVEASCVIRKAWNSFRKAAISARSSAITPGELEGVVTRGLVAALGGGKAGDLPALGRAR